MTTLFFSHLRNTLVALGVLAGLSVPAVAAAPFPGFVRAARTPVAAEANLLQVHYRRYNRRYSCYNYGGCAGYAYRNYGGYKYRNYGGYYRNYRPYRRHYPGLYFGLGVAPYAYYYSQPRRYYRGAGSGHVAWCYSRYRSYRAWDNTYQPYHGRRRQCWSPYS